VSVYCRIPRHSCAFSFCIEGRVCLFLFRLCVLSELDSFDVCKLLISDVR
jgi:hypothetical protein